MSKYILFVTTGLGDESSGVAIAVRKLAEEISELGRKIIVLTAEADLERVPQIPNVDVVAVKLHSFTRGINYSPELKSQILRKKTEISVVCVHGFWAPVLESACRSALSAGLPVVISPHGMFSRYSLTTRGFRKKIGLALGYRRTLERVTMYHATSRQEELEIRNLGLKQHIFIAPNGVETAVESEPRPEAGDRTKTLLFVSRIHPKKGLPMLMRAWSRLADSRPDWQLCVVGPDELNHLTEVKRIRDDLDIPRVTFSGAIYGKEKLSMMSKADVFVLPTYSENFGLVVAEALSVGTPVLTTNQTPWSKLDDIGCGWCVSADEDSILKGLSEATGCSLEQLSQMGQRGRDWMRVEFSWRSSAMSFVSALDNVVLHETCDLTI